MRFLWELGRRLGRHQVGSRAAALAYYTLFSMVPLLFSILTLGSFFVDAARIERLALNALDALLPTSGWTVTIRLEDILRYRRTLGGIAILGAIWSGSGIFAVLEAAVNAAWERPQSRTFWKRRLIGILALLSATAWILLALFSRTLWQLLPHWFPFLKELPLTLPTWTEQGLAVFSILILDLTVLSYFPTREVDRWIALGIALGVSVVWMLSREAFAWALTAGLLRYPILYGSLWVLIVPLVWAYWSYLILLIGAELQAYLEERKYGKSAFEV
ncbi:MAG: YihY/virulence factor BrkB family protein [Anaerolineae bacterium]